VKPVKHKWGASGGFGRGRKSPPTHPHDEIDFYEAILLEQTQLRPGSWLSEELRQIAIKFLADKARKAPLGTHPPLRQVARLQKQARERQLKWEREEFFVLLRCRYFVEVVSRSARGQTLFKDKSRDNVIKDAAEEFGMRKNDIKYEVRHASFYNAVNAKWKAWVASIRAPQERPLPARVRSTRPTPTNPHGYAAPEFRTITHHRPHWTIDDVTERAAAVAVRMIRRATAGVEWPDARTKELFAEFDEDKVRDHFKKRFKSTIRREQAAQPR
jgi:hypothetical protein